MADPVELRDDPLLISEEPLPILFVVIDHHLRNEGRSSKIKFDRLLVFKCSDTGFILVRFYLGERKIEVEAIIDRWLAPDHRYFKVRGDDKVLYVIRHETMTDKWELTMFDRTGT